MKRKIFAGWSFYIFGPLVVVLAVAALAVSGAATFAAYRAAQAHAQLIGIVSEVRQMRILSEDTHDRVAREFYRRLSAIGYDVIDLSPPFMGRAGEKGLRNPWGGDVRVDFFPAQKSFRVQTEVSSIACRKALFHLAEVDNKILQLRRVDIKEDDPSRIWRMIYEEGSAEGGRSGLLREEAIQAGCGQEMQNILSLVFYL